ncbi:hypothetical protein BP6252_13978 [Coleophoma cylindrospora]|uniref:Zn(2)-C6 fungal-type domain-containing protein n=1 Tax=Coleophoma cylindrospora TaxID=1849047 RepID=A0A3D8Q4I3_9HELO|nr:hypothetical protein BP6252_13978 [Coleophoma cylindrospora]
MLESGATTTPSSSGVVQRQHGYRGRVRTGCLTCRSRKIKCDEMRPTCRNCTKFEKLQCVYKPRKSQHPPPPPQSQSSATASSPGTASAPGSGTRSLPGTGSASEADPKLTSKDANCAPAEPSQHDAVSKVSSGAVHDGFLSPDSAIADVIARWRYSLRRPNELSIIADDPDIDITSPSTLISQDIKLTTTMDKLTASELPMQLAFAYFVESVDCPSITPYDGVNWRHTKLEVVELGMSNAAVASAILAVSGLYKAQMYGLPLSNASSLYRVSKNAFEKLLSDETEDFGTILTTAFLLCVFEFVHYETFPILREPSELFLKRLALWAQNPSSHSDFFTRIVVWMRILHATTVRGGGGLGLISHGVCCLLPCYKVGVPDLRLPSTHQPDPSTQLVQMLCAPLFEFYFQLQVISGEMAKLTHYHRSRTTGVDQEEVIQQTTLIKSRLHALWEARSTTQSQTPDDLRSHLAPKIATPVIALSGVCAAAYHTETVEMDRVLGDPVSERTDSKQAMRRIREIVDGDWNAYEAGKLNSGYLRPLFTYAIECMDREKNQWAVDRLREIKDPICRSDFFAAFGKALSDAQLRKERRVTSKYFCIWYFGVPPPFM